MEKIRSTNINVDNEIFEGKFENINSYLNNNFRNFGSKLSSKELLEKSTGFHKPDENIFINYVKQKYL